jgi:BASS family bile acid:Na+ symporter
MDSAHVMTLALLGALALVMFGLGLSLAVADFRRLLQHPRAVVIALLLQAVLLPVACYAIVVGLGLAPVYAVGLMLLAASPGGVSANLFSHLFGGNVAMNISLTAINTVLSIVTLPLIANWSIRALADSSQVVPLQTGKVVEVIVVVLVPVVIGMAMAARSPQLAQRMEKPFKLFSALVLAVFAIIAIAKGWDALRDSFASVGPAVLLFNLVSLLAGYFVSRAAGLEKPLATAIGFEIGIHNSTLSLFIAMSVLKDFQLALPSAIYSMSMYLTAALFGMLVLGRSPAGRPAQEAARAHGV